MHIYNTADLIDLALSVLSSASTLIQTDEPRDMHVVRGKLGLAGNNVNHMQGQVEEKIKGKGKCGSCGGWVDPGEEVCPNCKAKK